MAKTTAIAKIPEDISAGYLVPGSKMNSGDQVKLARLLIKAEREKNNLETLKQLGTVIAGSPIVQIVGTVLICEWMENKDDPWISSGWATGIEAGTIALVGLHVLQNYGFMGLGIAGTAGLTGGILGADIDSKTIKEKIQAVAAEPGAQVNPIGMLWNIIKAIL